MMSRGNIGVTIRLVFAESKMAVTMSASHGRTPLLVISSVYCAEKMIVIVSTQNVLVSFVD